MEDNHHEAGGDYAFNLEMLVNGGLHYRLLQVLRLQFFKDFSHFEEAGIAKREREALIIAILL